MSSSHHACKDGEKAFQTSGSIVMALNPAWILVYNYLHIGYGMDTGSTISPLLYSPIHLRQKNPKHNQPQISEYLL